MAKGNQKTTQNPIAIGIMLCSTFLFAGCLNSGGSKSSLASSTKASAVTISPSTATVGANVNVSFVASGGSGMLLYQIASGSGSISATSGVYTSPNTSGTATIRVIDSVGNTATATVTTLALLTMSAAPLSTIAVNSSTTITASGGTAPYTYAVNSGGAGGSIVAATGVYTAPASVGSGSDVITATDSIGKTGTITITVNPVLTISPSTHSLAVNNTKTFTATGGSPPYTYSVVGGGAGGTIVAATGVYTAPAAVGGGIDMVRVTDAASVTSTSTVTVNAALTITPSSLTISAKQTRTFVAAGGVSTAYTYSVLAGGAGGTITSGGVYTASATAGTDTVSVTDAVGNTASATIVSLGRTPLISAGESHTCQIFSEILRCWGLNASGQLGDGTNTQRTSPTSTYPGVSFYSVSTGQNHSCAITTGGVLMCSGENTENQLGDGGNTDRTAWTVIDVGVSYASVSGGDLHTCGITTAGVLKCWGENADGQVGDGTTDPVVTPQVISAGTPYALVSAGGSHTCGITQTGVVNCWGLNDNGQIGDASLLDRTSPTALSIGGTYKSISSGGKHSCAVNTSSQLYCWGDSEKGQVGDGIADPAVNYQTATLINSLFSYSVVFSGLESTCAITTAGALRCWGENTTSALGDGTTVDRSSPTAIDTAKIYSSVSSSNGGYFGCGMLTNNSFRCWGGNGNGQIGNGTIITASTPVDVP